MVSLTPVSGPSSLPVPCATSDIDAAAAAVPAAGRSDGGSDPAEASDVAGAAHGRQRRVFHCFRRLAGLTSTRSTCEQLLSLSTRQNTVVTNPARSQMSHIMFRRGAGDMQGLHGVIE